MGSRSQRGGMQFLSLVVMCAATAGYFLVGYWVYLMRNEMHESLQMRDIKLQEAAAREAKLVEELSATRREAVEMRDRKIQTAAQDLSNMASERGRLEQASERMLRITEELEGVRQRRAEHDPVWAAQTPERKGTCGFQCNLHAHKWLFIVGAGRSGSTTALSMLNRLPKIQLDGEHNGIVNNFLTLADAMVYTRNQGIEQPQHLHNRGASWFHTAVNVAPTEVYCLMQHWFFLHTGSDCSDDTIHGFKEIRYTTRRTLDFMRDAFPTARFVVNVRKQVPTKEYQEMNRAADFTKNVTGTLQEWARQNSDRSFELYLEEFNTDRFTQLANWLGIPCKAQFVQHAHKRGAAGGPFTIDNDPTTSPWLCTGNVTTSPAEIP
eukprot:CAMPEP_0118925630 /NCGR_PEP_ID=MMETSP1169-20130426/3487_1 /TAXON_ID=36882 /ORGANISM="Pyramimonas obovata, Strain CCMP722" /LENGTH=378 /DNA_ID=CAMNT_0006866979 /DNA_START=218 /DNA_END=1354 /DNA_ORIENTATION=-